MHRGRDLLDGGVGYRVLPDHGGRGLLTASDAGRVQHAHIPAQDGGQALQQFAGAGHLARQAVAHPHRERLRRCFAFLDDVEVVIERRDLIDLGLRQPHLLGQGRQMGGR